jgi:hypothetical protein
MEITATLQRRLQNRQDFHNCVCWIGEVVESLCLVILRRTAKEFIWLRDSTDTLYMEAIFEFLAGKTPIIHISFIGLC